MTKLGFFNMIQRLSYNPCIGENPQSPRKKKARVSKSKFKAMMIVFFSISRVLSTLIGCLKVRLSVRFIIKMF